MVDVFNICCVIVVIVSLSEKQMTRIHELSEPKEPPTAARNWAHFDLGTLSQPLSTLP